MGIFSSLFGTNDIDTGNIKSVVLLNQTQLFTEEVRTGVSFGGTWGDSRVMKMAETVPTGTEFTFSVTYKDKTKKIIKAKNGTTVCDKLLQLVFDDEPVGENASVTQNEPKKREAESVTVGKNQLPAGVYIIGKDIPVGTYDFKWIWGSGSISKFKDETTTLGASTGSFNWIGIEHDYEKTLVLNLICKDGEYLHIDGNVLVEISRSKPIQIDL